MSSELEESEVSTRDAVHRVLTDWIDRYDRPPSTREIAQQLEPRRTASTVHIHLLHLAISGKIMKESSEGRAVWIPVCYPDGRPWLRRAELLALVR